MAAYETRYTKPKLSSGRVHPYLIYGTAFKDDRTGSLTEIALKKGFEGLDSANYPAAYQEPQVGEALQKALKSGVKREDILVRVRQ